jgi:hypothetical protein
VKSFFVVAVPLFLCACAIDPSAIDDYSGLGDSPLGKRLHFSLFLGESTVNDSVMELVNKTDDPYKRDLTDKLLSIGFNCKPLSEMTCSYDGSAKSNITSADGSKNVKFITFVHIDVIRGTTPIEVISKITRRPY